MAERQFFNACRDQLNSDWQVLYNVEWFGHKDGRNETSDADFVLLHVKHGVWVVEVKGGAEIFVEDGTWYSRPHDSPDAVAIKDPFKQAADSKRALYSHLKKNLPDLALHGSFGHFVALPGHRQFGDWSPSAPRRLICDRYDMKSLESFLLGLSRLFNQKHELSSVDIDRIRECLRPSRQLNGSRKLELAALETDLDDLTELVLRVVEGLSREKRMVVVGPPGSGKTLLALQRTYRLVEQDLKVLYLAYSRRLTDALRARTNDLLPSAADNITFLTFDELGWEFVTDFTDRHEPDLMDLRNHSITPLAGKVISMVREASENGDLEFLLLEAGEFRREKPWRLYDAIVVDEAQLLNRRYFTYLEQILNDGGYLYIFGDPAQVVDNTLADGFSAGAVTHTYDNSLLRSAIEMPGMPQKALNVNCRSSLEIATYCANLVGDKPDEFGASGGDVQTVHASVSELVDRVPSIVSEWVHTHGIETSEIRLLYVNPLFYDHLPKSLPEHGLVVSSGFAVNWRPVWLYDDVPDEIARVDELAAAFLDAHGNPPVLTPTYFGEFLGLEAKAVIVLAHDLGGFEPVHPVNYRPTEASDSEAFLNRVRTAASRAQSLLAIIGDSTIPPPHGTHRK